MVAFFVPFTAGPGWDYGESKDKDRNYSQVGTGGGDVSRFQRPLPIAVLLKHLHHAEALPVQAWEGG